MVVAPRRHLRPRPPKGRGLFVFIRWREVVSMDDDDDNDQNKLASTQITPIETPVETVSTPAFPSILGLNDYMPIRSPIS